jgi:hypothetical protein
MSRTKRVYNKPNNIFGIWSLSAGWQSYWHPYRELGVGRRKCWLSREERIKKWRRQQAERELRRDLENYRLKNTFLGIYI